MARVHCRLGFARRDVLARKVTGPRSSVELLTVMITSTSDHVVRKSAVDAVPCPAVVEDGRLEVRRGEPVVRFIEKAFRIGELRARLLR